MSHTFTVALVGVILGLLGAVGVYFDPGEPYPGFITAAGALHGMTIGLLILVFVSRKTSISRCLGWGAVLSLPPSLMVFLAKGGWASWDAPFVVPAGVVNGIILGLIVRWLARREARRAAAA